MELLAGLLRKALDMSPAKRLWVNPGCGRKTRGWAEVAAAILTLAAARKLRDSVRVADSVA